MAIVFAAEVVATFDNLAGGNWQRLLASNKALGTNITGLVKSLRSKNGPEGKDVNSGCPRFT